MSAATPASAPEPNPAGMVNGGEPEGSSAVEVTAATGDAAAVAAGTGFAADGPAEEPAPLPAAGADPRPRKGPLSFLSGALTSALLAWLCLGLSQKVVAYYALHPPHYTAQIAQSIATALKTLIVGMCFLATFSFAFIGVGLSLTFLRSLMPGYRAQGES